MEVVHYQMVHPLHLTEEQVQNMQQHTQEQVQVVPINMEMQLTKQAVGIQIALTF